MPGHFVLLDPGKLHELRLVMQRDFMRLSLLSLVLAAICFGKSLPVAADTLPTYVECVSAYQQNVRGLMPLSVEWTIEDQDFAPVFAADLRAIPILQAALESGNVKADKLQKAEILEQMRKSLIDAEARTTPEAQSSRLQPRRFRQFFWTDGTRVQARTHQRPREDVDKPLDDGFGETSSQTLIEDFGTINVFSFVPGRSPKLREWVGLPSNGSTPTGRLGSKNLTELHRVKLPPLGGIQLEATIVQNVSPLDSWTALSQGLERIERGDPLHGEETVVVRYAFAGGLDNRIDRVTIWLAHKKGFIPLKIERTFSGGELSVDPAPGFPPRIFEVIEVAGIEQYKGGYYPRRVTTTHWDTDPDWRSKQTAPITFATEVPRVPFRRRTEEFLRVLAHRPLSEASIALEFPKGTRYRDEDTNDSYLEGTPKEEFDRQLAQAELKEQGSDAVSGRSKLPLFIGANVGAITLLALIYAYGRARSRQR